MSKRKTIIAEEALVSLLQSKDERGFSILYENYSSALYGVVLKIVRSEEVAADVMQDAFVKIWKNIEAYSRAKGREPSPRIPTDDRVTLFSGLHTGRSYRRIWNSIGHGKDPCESRNCTVKTIFC